MKESYFIRVSRQTPTKFWINNPSRQQAGLAIEHGAQSLGFTKPASRLTPLRSIVSLPSPPLTPTEVISVQAIGTGPGVPK